MTGTIIPLFVPGGMGPPELAIILVLAILLFGANKIPKLARSTGEAIGEFQKGKEKVDKELEEMRQTADLDSGTTTEPESQAATTLSEESDTTATTEDTTTSTADETSESDSGAETEPETEAETES